MNPSPPQVHSQPPFNVETWYRISSKSEPSLALDVVNDAYTATVVAVNLVLPANFSGQHWQLHALPSPNRNFYALTCMYQGLERRLEMSEAARPHLGTSVGGRQQEWQVVRVEGTGEGVDAVFTVSNMAVPLRLGLREGSSAVWGLPMGEDGEGVRWRITPIRPIYEPAFLLLDGRDAGPPMGEGAEQSGKGAETTGL